jgi:8-oxo-dGTP diphosphatase
VGDADVTFTLDLVLHMDAGDRNAWQADQDTRPLTDFGERQARAQCDALAAEPVDAIYAGPALRCRQTVQPLAEQLGLEGVLVPEIGETAAWHAPGGWDRDNNQDTNSAAHAAGSAMRAVAQMRELHPEGRAVACSHGHVIPALASALIALHGLRDVPELTRRGQWYRVRFDGERVRIELREVEALPEA